MKVLNYQHIEELMEKGRRQRRTNTSIFVMIKIQISVVYDTRMFLINNQVNTYYIFRYLSAMISPFRYKVLIKTNKKTISSVIYIVIL